MSAVPITWRAWYAAQEAQSPQALLSTRWAITPQGLAALRAAEGHSTAVTAPAPRRCVWCKKPIRRGQPSTVVGGEPMHVRPCLGEFDAHAYGTDDQRGEGE